MKTEENIKDDEQATIEANDENTDGGLKISTNVKAGGICNSD